MSDLEPYRHQVGGWHKGLQSCVLKDKKGLILKPLKLNANPTYNKKVTTSKSSNQTDNKKLSDEDLIPVCQDELQFYEHLQTSTSLDDLRLKPLLPEFHGSRQVVLEDGKAVPHLVLGDLAAGLELPCVVDIKMGYTFYYPGKEQYKNKSKYATQGELGFCLTGLRVFHPDSGSIITELRPDACKQLTVTQVFEGLETFCQRGSIFSGDLRHALMTQLLRIHEWFLSQRSYKIRCGSILMMYDAKQFGTRQQIVQSVNGISVPAAVSGVPSMCEPQLKVTVKMIDLAHVLYSNGERDENYIFGLDNLIKYLSRPSQ